MANIDIKKEHCQEVDRPEAAGAQETERTRERSVFVPRADIYEREDALVLVADMPGVNENKVDINVERRVLTITGNVGVEEVKDHRLNYAEYETGDFERSFRLAGEVDVDKIEATVKDGVLRLVLPKAETARPKKIAVRAG